MTINNQAIQKLKNSKQVAIFIHINPDGDCLGSASALKQALVSLNKQVDIFCDSPVSERYNFVKYISEINNKTCLSYDLLVALDCPNLKRIGEYETWFKEHENTIKIDHHDSEELFANINILEHVSSTCLIIYNYLKAMNIEITSEIACALYMGIATDTGCFQHSNTTSTDHIVASELINTGFNLAKTNDILFKSCSKSRFNLLQIALNSSKFFFEGKVGIITLTKNDLQRAKAVLSDTTGIVDYITNVDGVEIGIIIYEESFGLFKCSFRSRGKYDVNKIANVFGGGGHKFASGCNIYGSASTAIKKIIEICSTIIED